MTSQHISGGLCEAVYFIAVLAAAFEKAFQPLPEKIRLASTGKSPLRLRAVLSHQEGRLAIATNAGQDAVDAGPFAWRAGSPADGEAVWS